MPEEVSAQTSLDYATDYTTYLLQEDDTPELEETPKLRGHELIDGFIERSEEETSIRLQPADEIKLSPKRKRARRIMKKMKMIAVSPKQLAKIYVKQASIIPRHLKLLKKFKF